MQSGNVDPIALTRSTEYNRTISNSLKAQGKAIMSTVLTRSLLRMLGANDPIAKIGERRRL